MENCPKIFKSYAPPHNVRTFFFSNKYVILRVSRYKLQVIFYAVFMFKYRVCNFLYTIKYDDKISQHCCR